jgi:alpha-D-xyloside xylohydrolase
MKQFYRCTRILDHSKEHTHLDFTCVLGTHGTTTLRIIPVAEEIIGIQIIPKVVDPTHSPRIPKESQTTPSWSFREDTKKYIVEVGTHSLTIGKDPFSLTVHDREGNTILASTDDDQTTWNFPLTSGWGVDAMVNGQNIFSSIESTHITFLSRPDEQYYGLGEQFGTCGQKGTKKVLHNENGQGVRALSYKNVPFVISSYGYGIFVDTYRDVTFDLARTSNRSIEIINPDVELDVYLMLGSTPKQILDTYTRFTGRPPQVPLWSYGLWISTYFIETDEKRVREQVEGYRTRKIPLDVYHFDCFWLRDNYWNDFTWNTQRFPDPKKLMKEMKDSGLKISLWENPYISIFSKLYDEAEKQGFLLKNTTGETYRAQTWRKDLMPATGIVDFTNPRAIEWWKQHHEKLMEMGVDVFKTDFGEAVPEDSVFANGKTGKDMHNAYAHIYNACVYEETARIKKEAMVWARSAWAGTQRYPTHWGGDPHCTWEDMASGLRGGLSFSLSGFAYWSHDIGGFKGIPDSELYIRWAQLGMFGPHARLHGWSNRDPWIFGDEAVDILRTYTRIRYSLLPYFDHLGTLASKQGLPLMRHLYLEYPEDPVVRNIDSQYMLGDGVLVNPILKRGGSVDYYLPEGNWFNLGNGEIRSGRTFVHETCALEEMPVYLKVGYPLLRTRVQDHITPDQPYEELIVQIALDGTIGNQSFILPISHGEVSVEIAKLSGVHDIAISISGDVVHIPIQVLVHGEAKIVSIDGSQLRSKKIGKDDLTEYAISTEGTLYSR